MSKPKVGLVGGGSWATAIAKMLCKNHEIINWWVRNDGTKDYIEINKHNPNYLSSVEFNPEQLQLTTDINELVEKSDWIDRKSTRLNSSHVKISYAVFCLKKKK